MKKIIPPIAALIVGVFHAYEAAMAAAGGQYLRMTWKGALSVALLVLARFMYDTGKRFTDS